MYIIVNKDNIIIASSKSKPSEEICSENSQRIYEVDDAEYDINMIGQVLEDFDVVERK